MNSPDQFYRDKAERYKPNTPEGIAKAARDLLASGFTVYTAAAVLRVDVNALRQMIGAPA